jgi:hypothetical protein
MRGSSGASGSDERQAGARIGTKATSRNVTIWPLSKVEREMKQTALKDRA